MNFLLSQWIFFKCIIYMYVLYVCLPILEKDCQEGPSRSGQSTQV